MGLIASHVLEIPTTMVTPAEQDPVPDVPSTPHWPAVLIELAMLVTALTALGLVNR